MKHNLKNQFKYLQINKNKNIMKTKCKVVMLPTNNKTHIVICYNNHILYAKELQESRELIQTQHLYLVSDNEEEEVDYIFIDYKRAKIPTYDTDNSPIKKVCKVIYDKDDILIPYTYIYNTPRGEEMIECIFAYKVIATTDESLGLPLIPEQFVKEYCNKQVDEVIVNIKDIEICYNCRKEPEHCTCGDYITMNIGKQVIVTPFKKTWTREELPIKEIQEVIDYCDANKIHRELKELKELKEIFENSSILSINYMKNYSYSIYTASFFLSFFKEDLNNLINSKINKLKNEFKSI